MGKGRTLQLGSLEETLSRVPYALTLSDLGAEDEPLLFMNSAFKTMTGCTNEHLGRNCRFLQADLDNDAARAEIRLALTEKRRTQVVLKNRRMSGELFHNLLLLEPVAHNTSRLNVVLGAQFELSDAELAEIGSPATQISRSSAEAAAGETLRLRLKRRRLAANSAVQLLQSWLTLDALSNGS